MAAATLARSASINDLDAATATAFGLLPTNTNINQGTVNYAVDTGAANAYVVAMPQTALSYADGLCVNFKPVYSCTAASTINVDSLGLKTIKLSSGADVSTGNIIAGTPVELRYSTTTGFFHLMGAVGIAGPAGSLSGTAVGVVDLLTGANIASASTINLDTATGNRVHITGTVTISAVTLTRGPRTVIFDGALTLTHHATNNNLPGGASIITAAGDRAIYESDGTTVRCITYSRATNDHEVVVHTGNGHGGTNTKIRRFSTAMTNTGTAITYADSAANGASFTINEAGIYSISYSDSRASNSAAFHGASLNSAQLTTAVESITVANRLSITQDGNASVDLLTSVSRVAKLAVGDVVRPHTSGSQASTTDTSMFSIRKISNI